MACISQDKPWSEREETILREGIAAHKSAYELEADLPGRTRSAISRKGRRMGLRFDAIKHRPPRPRAKYERSPWGSACWDKCLFEPYAVFKARKQRERAEART